MAGAHGGAGTSTLAALLAPAWDMGVVQAQLPRPGGCGPAAGRSCWSPATRWRRPAGRSTAVTAVTGTGLPVAVLAVISDGLPEPAEARYRFRVLEGRVGAVVRVPFVPAFRVAGSPLQVEPAAPGTPGAGRDPGARRRTGPVPRTRHPTVRRPVPMPAILLHALAVHAAAGHLTAARARRRLAWRRASPTPPRRPRRGCPAR